ncbi:MAG: DUF4397 domain-containing protein [Ardenticatenaceae bacterium]|nr:DUF4397 domain-containing protein [Ardenticatenaceae bacterium]
MRRKQSFLFLAVLMALLLLLPVVVLAQQGKIVEPDSAETLLEQARARAAERETAVSPSSFTSFFPQAVEYPLLVGVDNTAVPVYQIDPVTNNTVQAFTNAEVWGAAFDEVNNRLFFNSGSTLYEWPIGGAVNQLGTIVDTGGVAQAIVGLAFHNGTLYGTKNIANEAVYIIDPTTLVATVYIDYVDADYDFGGLAVNPATGELYATNDDAAPFGSGLFRINLDGTATQVAPYPAGQTDIDGLTIGDDGYAYLVIDEPGFIYVYDFAAGAYTTPLTNPWSTAELFSGGAWISDVQAQVAVAHLAPFAVGAETAVTITLNSTPVLTNFLYGDSTPYMGVPAGAADLAVYPAGSATPAITATFNLTGGLDYSIVAIGDGVNQPLQLVALADDNSAPTAGNAKLRLGHLSPFASVMADTLADIRLQDGTPVLTNVLYSAIVGYLELPAGEYDLKVTTPGGGVTLIDPLPVTFVDGQIVNVFATGDGNNQPFGAFAWPPDAEGAFLPLAEYGVVVSADVTAQSGMPGALVTYTLALTNTGNLTDSFSFTAAGNDWAVELPMAVTLAVSETIEASVVVTIPVAAPDMAVDVVTVTVTSQGNASVSDGLTLTTTAVSPMRYLYLPIIMKP